MGRKKMQMKLIADKSSRQVTFSKRRNGMIKKARELSVLCDIDIAAVIFSSRGRLYEYCSSGSLASILDRYYKHYEEEAQASAGVKNAADSDSEYISLLSHAELMQLVQRELEGPNFEQLSLNELSQLEQRLHVTLAETNAKKTELFLDSVKALEDKGKKLNEEKELLEEKFAELEKNNGSVDANVYANANPVVKATLHLLR